MAASGRSEAWISSRRAGGTAPSRSTTSRSSPSTDRRPAQRIGGSRLELWITGGGTREPIDAVRWIGNRSTGRMAIAIAREASRRSHRVTLFLAADVAAPRLRGLRVERFVTSNDLAALLRRTRPGPDAVAHAAAVSDYAPAPVRGKVPSGRDRWTLRLEAQPKLVHSLRRRHPRAVLCTFKLESGVSLRVLRDRAQRAAARAGARFVFANRIEDVGAEHRGLLVDVETGTVVEARTRAAAARAVVRACEAGFAEAEARATARGAAAR